MKKILVLLLMFTLLSAVSCDDDEGGVGGGVRLQDLDSEQIYPADGTEAEGVGDKFTGVLSRSTSGWSAYRWTTSTTEDPDTTADETDCNGAYKVSYLERASENVHRFVGGGMCLGSSNDPSYPTDARVENLRALVDDAMENSTKGINSLSDISAGDEFIDNYVGINSGFITDRGCHEYSDPADIDGLVPEGSNVPLNNEDGELYLFIAEIKLEEEGDSTVNGSVVKVMLEEPKVIVTCHPDPSLEGENVYRLTDDSGREFIKEVVDELLSLKTESSDANDNDQELIDEGVWNVYTFPKLGEDETLNDPSKLSYFRISKVITEIGSGNRPGDDRQFIVGAGIYLDVNNPNAGDSDRLEPIRTKVREAAALLLVGEDEEGELPDMFFEDNPDATDEFQEVVTGIAPTDEQGYIFVWENR